MVNNSIEEQRARVAAVAAVDVVDVVTHVSHTISMLSICFHNLILKIYRLNTIGLSI